MTKGKSSIDLIDYFANRLKFAIEINDFKTVFRIIATRNEVFIH